jgi:hypothetical protein
MEAETHHLKITAGFVLSFLLCACIFGSKHSISKITRSRGAMVQQTNGNGFQVFQKANINFVGLIDIFS